MAGYVRFISKKHHPLAIGLDVREPVVEIVGKYLLLVASARLHSPNLHMACALGVEVDVFPVGSVFRTVIKAFGCSQSGLFTARCGYRIDVELAVTLANECERLPIPRPTMPIGRRLLRDAARRSSADGNNVNDGVVVFLRVVANRQLRGIRRN